MNLFISLSLILSGFFSTQSEVPVLKEGNISFYQHASGMGDGMMRKMATFLEGYLISIEEGDYNKWYGCLSDSTIARVQGHKFPKKFDRLKEYGISLEGGVKVLEIRKIENTYKNELGSEYELLLEFNNELKVGNRVSFDYLKRKDDKVNSKQIGVNIIMHDKIFGVCIHKYVNTDAGQNNHQ